MFWDLNLNEKVILVTNAYNFYQKQKKWNNYGAKNLLKQ